MLTLRIKNKNGEVDVLYDEQDRGLINSHTWRVIRRKVASGCFYDSVVTNIKNGSKMKTATLSRLIMGLGFGNKMTVDHINHNNYDNRRQNLRTCTMQQNLMNRRKSAGKKLKYKGVHLNPHAKNPYQARIGYNGKDLYLGSFMTEEEAAIKYDFTAKRLYGEYCQLNFPCS